MWCDKVYIIEFIMENFNDFKTNMMNLLDWFMNMHASLDEVSVSY